MNNHPLEPRLIVVGSSIGGIEALSTLVAGLPPDLSAAVCVVQHVHADHSSHLPQILCRAGPLPVTHARDGELMVPGRVYVAPPGHHLLVRGDHLALSDGPRENHSRPAIDVLFRSAARHFGAGVIGVVLTGALDDGSAGLLAIRRAGGVGVVQDPADALCPDMPCAAIEAAAPDYILPLAAISACVRDLIHRVSMRDAGAEQKEHHVSIGADNPLVFGCPECGGPLVEGRDGQEVGLRCRVGHAYAPQTLLAAQAEQVEAALWMAIRTLEERAELADRLHARALASGLSTSAPRFAANVAEAQAQADLLRKLVLGELPVAKAAD